MGRILVVDDSVVNQRLSVALLKQRGYEVEAVGNGKEAVRVLCEEAKHYDVALMDCHMPEMDGFEASAQVRAHDGPNRNNIIIALTGTLEETQMINCNNSGMNDYLDKPMKIDAFEFLETLPRGVGAAGGKIESGRNECATRAVLG